MEAGDTFNVFVFGPEVHVYVVAPLAVNDAVCPAQIVGLFTEIEIPVPIVTEAVADVVQVPLAPTTETVVFDAGAMVYVLPEIFPGFQV